MALIDVQALKDFHKSTVTYDEWLYAEAIDAAEQYLRDETGRELKLADAVATARVFRPVAGSDVLFIDDAAEITAVTENGATLTANTDYVAEPFNNKINGQYRPTDRLIRYGVAWYSDGPKATVSVTAKWGWTSIPPGLTFALYVCAKAYLQSRDVSFGLVAITEQGAAGERDGKAVKDFIDNYRNRGSWGIA